MSESDPMAPIRRWERADVNVAVVCRGRDEAIRDFARKLGAGGMFVETRRPKPVGSRVELSFNLPGFDQPVELAGTVTWIREVDPPRAGGMGIAFVGVEEHLRAQIDRLVRSVNAEASASS
jgi:uncharacterized protein (TIGR02266 family)